MSFVENMERAGDHPNAFKTALRMAEFWSGETWSRQPPTRDGHTYEYTLEHDGSPTTQLALGLLEAALHKVHGGALQDCNIYNKDRNNACLRVPHETFPKEAVIRQLNVLQSKLASNWVKDGDGNYRHTKLFEHMGRYGMDADLDRLDRCRLTPALLTKCLNADGAYSPEDLEKMQLLCAFKNLKPLPITQLPVDDPELELRGYTVGLCLTPEQLGIVSKTVGFLNPARSKGA